MQAAIKEARPPALRGRGIRCRKMRPSRAARAGAGLEPIGLTSQDPHRSLRGKGRCELELRWLVSLAALASGSEGARHQVPQDAL